MRCTPHTDAQIKLFILSWRWKAAFDVIDMLQNALINFFACGFYFFLQVTVDMNIERNQWHFFFYNLLV